jgi:hypothetical protein
MTESLHSREQKLAWNFKFKKGQRLSWTAEQLLASQGLCSVELVHFYLKHFPSYSKEEQMIFRTERRE